MQGFDLTPKQIQELRTAHRKEPAKRNAYKINAVILLGTGWTLQQVSEAFLLDEETLRTYVFKYKTGGIKVLLQTIDMGRACILTQDEKNWLNDHVAAHLYSKAADIKWSLYEHVGKRLSVRTITRLLSELNFSYKKTKLVPGKADPAAQAAFLAYYEKLKGVLKKEDSIYFVDSTHPTHNTETGYAWVKTGEDKQVLSNSGRQRISVNGAVDIENLKAIATRTETTNGQTMVELFKKIEDSSEKTGVIHLILDNARYNYSSEVKRYVECSRIVLHYLPPYSPNLNPIERLWKFMKGEVIKKNTIQLLKNSIMPYSNSSNISQDTACDYVAY